jgi:hypothetical protein
MGVTIIVAPILLLIIAGCRDIGKYILITSLTLPVPVEAPFGCGAAEVRQTKSCEADFSQQPK